MPGARRSTLSMSGLGTRVGGSRSLAVHAAEQTIVSRRYRLRFLAQRPADPGRSADRRIGRRSGAQWHNAPIQLNNGCSRRPDPSSRRRSATILLRPAWRRVDRCARTRCMRCSARSWQVCLRPLDRVDLGPGNRKGSVVRSSERISATGTTGSRLPDEHSVDPLWVGSDRWPPVGAAVGWAWSPRR
jgi:hypothetical protein